MDLAVFSYTKDDGSVSVRSVVLDSKPTDMYLGTDVSEISDEQAVLYALAREQLKQEYLEKIQVLNSEYDLMYRTRQFKKAGVSNLTIEKIERDI